MHSISLGSDVLGTPALPRAIPSAALDFGIGWRRHFQRSLCGCIFESYSRDDHRGTQVIASITSHVIRDVTARVRVEVIVQVKAGVIV